MGTKDPDFKDAVAEAHMLADKLKAETMIIEGAGALDQMKTMATTRMGDIQMIEGAGHWIQQEQPAQLARHLLAFAKEVAAR
ncbi:alpha/beta fold hydrolase [Neorhizobium lilium]|uniref:alpha/beta fold hydrolase n=1 Tax=Neorhizobium lilium TaxID=2503024 RepID=UPI00197CE309|nr:hypothetical protein [Neorhizobium lilium]